MKKLPEIWVQIFKYFFVALAATIVDFMIFSFCRGFLNIPLSNTAGFVVGLIINYLLSTHWVFKSAKTKKSREVILFIVIGVAGLLISNYIVVLFAERWLVLNDLSIFINNILGYNNSIRILELIAKCIAVVVTFLWNFFARKIFIYN